MSFRLPAAVAEAFDRAAAVSAAALAAAAATLADSAAEVRAKWPNDLLLEAPASPGSWRACCRRLSIQTRPWWWWAWA